ncbi:nucleotidyltransferase family protein [Colwellia sp. 1_MG-2023]|uniref:N-acetylmuramate alpha-1-phosphate uridylyltransferase MurU n=1 Tax=Colwellia sp. 1_MG-2023 TaxID=3062649 RepID=UPI0026E3C34C|nr:nucleotidyltransferase family protein [Colwellia sp. 1_MG-2023]MDO6447330.1 nucleotidyltransferase family protein [Colwellia sp. 1_MG-2023]
MKAMILAAGRGERMRPLTDKCPKPLLCVAGIPLIEYHIKKLAKIGVSDIVINLAWLGERIVDYLQDGEKFGVNFQYSWENDGALETAGGIIKALPKLVEGNEPFLVVNGDIYIDYDFSPLPHLTEKQQAHLWVVDNPPHNVSGDFYLNDGVLQSKQQAEWEGKTEIQKNCFTFSGIGLYRPSLFHAYLDHKVMPLAPILISAMKQQQVSGEKLSGVWTDVGTPERLQQLNMKIQGMG